MKFLKKNNHQHGFTLIELSVVMIILASVAVNAVTTNQELTGVAARQETSQKVKRLKVILDKYMNEYNYIPCPADPTLTTLAANFGVGTGTNTTGGCTATNLVISSESSTGAKDEVYVGALPFKTLGLTPEDMLDGWGNKLTYAASRKMILKNCGAVGRIIVLNFLNPANAPNAQIAANITTSTAAYVIVSSGKDGVGAYKKNAATRIISRYESGNNDASLLSGYYDSREQMINHKRYNADMTTAVTADNSKHVFIKPRHTLLNTKFDDLVVYSEAITSISDPTQITGGVYAWFDGNDLLTLWQTSSCDTTAVTANAQPVRCWTNKGTDSNDATIAANEPAYRTNTLNSMSVVDFSTSDHLKVTFSSTLADSTIFIVGKRDAIPDDGEGMYYDGHTTPSYTHTALSDEYSMIHGSENITNDTTTVALTPEIHSNIWYTDEETASAHYLNGKLNVSGVMDDDELDGLTLGNIKGAAVGTGLDGYLAEIVVYDSILSKSDRNAVEDYLSCKWGINVVAE